MNARKVIAIVGAAAAVTVTLAAAGCGSSSTAPAASATPLATDSPAATSGTTSPQPSPQATAAPPGALTGEAASASAGDIPDNQVFLTLRDKALGFSMKYPEGWAHKGEGTSLTIQDKNNIVRVATSSGPAPTVASAERDMSALGQKTPSLTAGTPHALTIAGHPAVKVTYTTESTPNPVTGKTVKLMVDRYYFWRNGHVAVMDLGTPQGVDNVDAYRLMSESFRWK
jgi:hypothetical protein